MDICHQAGAQPLPIRPLPMKMQVKFRPGLSPADAYQLNMPGGGEILPALVARMPRTMASGRF